MAEPEPFCEREQLPRSMCAHCRADRRTITAVPVDFEALAELAEQGVTRDTGPLITAQHYGTCQGCGNRWEPGMAIAFSESEGAWICGDCARL